MLYTLLTTLLSFSQQSTRWLEESMRRHSRCQIPWRSMVGWRGYSTQWSGGGHGACLMIWVQWVVESERRERVHEGEVVEVSFLVWQDLWGVTFLWSHSHTLYCTLRVAYQCAIVCSRCLFLLWWLMIWVVYSTVCTTAITSMVHTVKLAVSYIVLKHLSVHPQNIKVTLWLQEIGKTTCNL